MATKVQIVFYSTYGHIYRMAEAVAEGAREAGGVEVAAGSGSYILEEVQPPGRRPLPARILVAGDA